jgi:release factor glutamine methyltransferase
VSLTERLSRAGFIAAREEAEELTSAAAGDLARLEAMLERRLTGEPLAWITGSVMFCGLSIRVAPGVYVPRLHTELITLRALERLPERGTAVDLCTGCGAVAAVLRARRPRARILAADIDAHAVACARSNGVDAYCGDLFAALPRGLEGRVDVIIAVTPYVPTAALATLQRDTFTFETALAYDGGPDGTDVLGRVINGSTQLLRHGGSLVLELGGDQGDRVADQLDAHGYTDCRSIVDEDGDVRGIEATL